MPRACLSLCTCECNFMPPTMTQPKKSGLAGCAAGLSPAECLLFCPVFLCELKFCREVMTIKHRPHWAYPMAGR